MLIVWKRCIIMRYLEILFSHHQYCLTIKFENPWTYICFLVSINQRNLCVHWNLCVACGGVSDEIHQFNYQNMVISQIRNVNTTKTHSKFCVKVPNLAVNILFINIFISHLNNVNIELVKKTLIRKNCSLILRFSDSYGGWILKKRKGKKLHMAKD